MEHLESSITDHSLRYKHHNEYTHMGCILLRTTMAATLLSQSISARIKKLISMIMIVTLIIFTFKYISHIVIKKRLYWKNYPRFILIYTLALYLLHTDRQQYAGLLIFMDAVMGLESRHTAAVISKVCKK